MGGHPYFYWVPFQPDIQAALDELREREFRAGRYNPVMWFPEFPVGPSSPAPGPQHRTIREALAASDADGTRSILDLDHISLEPEFFAVTPVSDEQMNDLFGTTRPTREMIESSEELFEDIDRGQGIFVVAYRDGAPDEIYFAGYSFD
jgi:hypothetical protein